LVGVNIQSYYLP